MHYHTRSLSILLSSNKVQNCDCHIFKNLAPDNINNLISLTNNSFMYFKSHGWSGKINRSSIQSRVGPMTLELLVNENKINQENQVKVIDKRDS